MSPKNKQNLLRRKTRFCKSWIAFPSLRVFCKPTNATRSSLRCTSLKKRLLMARTSAWNRSRLFTISKGRSKSRPLFGCPISFDTILLLELEEPRDSAKMGKDPGMRPKEHHFSLRKEWSVRTHAVMCISKEQFSTPEKRDKARMISSTRDQNFRRRNSLLWGSWRPKWELTIALEWSKN